MTPDESRTGIPGRSKRSAGVSPSGRRPRGSDRPEGAPPHEHEIDALGGTRRAVLEGLEPEIDCGRFPVKRIVGDRMTVEVDAFADGHDAVRCVLLHREHEEEAWKESPMVPLGNDRWSGSFPLPRLTSYLYCAEAWVDRWLTWRRDLSLRLAAGQNVDPDLQIGAGLLQSRADIAGDADDRRANSDRALLLDGASRLLSNGGEPKPFSSPEELETWLDGPLGEAAARHSDRGDRVRYPHVCRVVVDRPRAGFSAWYEFFPRSVSSEPGTHGTFRDAEAMIPYIRDMGFDVVYLPPIHPIGTTKRKGPNNVTRAEPGDPGSPWAIGAVEGGHTAIHPALGSPRDFRRFRERVEEAGMEVALDIAFQCSPDHPWVEEHPQWFRHRPDGTIQYAENPPKRYQDIYPFDFESDDWPSLWRALRDVFLHWIGEGVRIFRVDNPHTKPFAFWEWAISDLRARHPDVIFLSEAFTRPRVMYRLAKLGFDQSYTYFTWRNVGSELAEYVDELTRTEVKEFFRPNFWPNTPDILNEFLQTGERPAFEIRVILASTLSSNWGMYGPAFELAESEPVKPGSEEYLASEKYQLRTWDLDDPESLRPLITRLNRIRRDHRAFQRTDGVRFHSTDNPSFLAYSKRPPPWEEPGTEGSHDPVLVVVNLDPRHIQSGWVEFDPEALGIEQDGPFTVHDLLGDERYEWQAGRNFVRLDPDLRAAHILKVATTP